MIVTPSIGVCSPHADHAQEIPPGSGDAREKESVHWCGNICIFKYMSVEWYVINAEK